VASANTFTWFFYSSKRRHTRSKRDWSSDVCSSDLLKLSEGDTCGQSGMIGKEPNEVSPFASVEQFYDDSIWPEYLKGKQPDDGRSEERRVGKEGRGERYREQRRAKRQRKHSEHQNT